MWDDSEAIVTRPFNLTLLAEALYLDGRVSDALELLAVADQTIQRHGERYYEPEVKRVQGVLRSSIAGNRDEHREACNYLDSAAAIARLRGTPASELRALSDRVRLYPEAGGIELSWTRLARVLAGITEGRNTTDLRAARALLEGHAGVAR